MKKITEVGTERILCSSVGRVLLLTAILALTFGVAGCQNGKCQSCLFRNRDKEKIDETQLGQVKNQEPPAPPTTPSASSFDSVGGQDQRIAIAPTPVEQAPANSLAANDLGAQRIPNTASGSDLAALSSRQPTLEPIPDANNQARNFSTPQGANAAPASRYQSVAPILPESALGFASPDQDHSASLAPEAKNDALPPAPNAPLPPEMTGQPLQAPAPTPAPAETTAQPSTNAPLPAELTTQPPTAIAREPNPNPNAVQPPAESATPDPAAASGEAENANSAEYSPLMRDQYAIDSAYAMKKPVTLKGTARAQYVGNTSAVSSAKNEPSATRSANRPGYRPYSEARPATAAQPSSVASSAPAVVPGDSAAFVPNGQTSNIIPGVKLGVVDFSQQR